MYKRQPHWPSTHARRWRPGSRVLPGAQVSPGTVIAVLSSSSVEQQVESSRLSLAQQQLSYQNTVDKLDDYTITAPIDGTVITKNTKVGDTLDTTNCLLYTSRCV